MNIAFWIVVACLLIGLWFLLSSFFGEIGDMSYGLFKRAKDEMERVEEDDEESVECVDDTVDNTYQTEENKHA